VSDQRERLRIVHDDGVAFIQMEPGGILKYYFFVDGLFGLGKLDLFTLQCIMQLLRTAEEARRALDQMPIGFNPDRIHHQRQRRQDFRNTAAIEG
jgi:hypothetical protein